MSRKKKIVIKSILLAAILSLIFFFLKKGYEYCDSILQFGKNYFGIFFIPAVLIIFLDIFFTFIDSKKKRILYKTRLLFSIIFTISVSAVYILGSLKYLNKLTETDIIESCIMKYNLGFLITNLIVYLFDTYKLNYVIIFFSFFIFLSLFFLIGKEIAASIRYFVKCKRKREALRLEKALLAQVQAQIAIKENLEEKKAVEYEKQNIILETVIKEKVEKAIEKDILPLETVTVKEISEENNNSPKEDNEK